VGITGRGVGSEGRAGHGSNGPMTVPFARVSAQIEGGILITPPEC
jgi:hypothetical protein